MNIILNELRASIVQSISFWRTYASPTTHGIVLPILSAAEGNRIARCGRAVWGICFSLFTSGA